MPRDILHLAKPRTPRGQRSQLILTRRPGESVEIGDSTVTAHINKGEITLVIKAPRETRILRSELTRKDAP